MTAGSEEWKRCSSCKKPIAFRATYFACSVSTCTRKRTGFVFCSVDCWEIHLPMMRHREAWAVEETAPTREAWAAEQAAERGEGSDKPRAAPVTKPVAQPVAQPVVRRAAEDAPRRIAVPSAPAPAAAVPAEVLVIASRFKEYIRARYGMNTSDAVFDELSKYLRTLADRAVLHARDDGRKTVLDRDFAFLTESR